MSAVCGCAGVEGKAGMAAAAHTGATLDLDAFWTGVKKSLPSYARPIFLRLLPSVDTTGEATKDSSMFKKKHQICKLTSHVSSSGTFKIQKTRLQRESYNPQASRGKIYYLNSRDGSYKALTEELYKDIMDGKTSL